MYPMEAPTPIQYQYASGKIPRDFKICTPNGSVESGGICNEKVFAYYSTQIETLHKSHLYSCICKIFHSWECDCISCLHGTNFFQGIHSQLWHFVHTSLGIPSNPITTTSSHQLMHKNIVQ